MGTDRAPFLAGLVVQGRRCVVLGGDREAEDKAARLCDAGASVALFAPQVTPALRQLADRRALHWETREALAADLDDAFLVLDARRDPALAAPLFERANRPGGFLLCAVDQPRFCTVTNVAVVRRGPLQIAVATAGLAPALAARIRAALEAQLGDDLAAFAERLAALRASTAPSARRAVMESALEGFRWVVCYVLPASPPEP
jgi:precorrin-2 dehydrogenase/sirohydrochlorin ferrochelatase